MVVAQFEVKGFTYRLTVVNHNTIPRSEQVLGGAFDATGMSAKHRVGLSYNYTLNSSKRLSDYNMEAQGDIVADYFAHTELKYPPIIPQKSNQDVALIPLYRTVLVDFLIDPSDKKSLPK